MNYNFNSILINLILIDRADRRGGGGAEGAGLAAHALPGAAEVGPTMQFTSSCYD